MSWISARNPRSQWRHRPDARTAIILLRCTGNQRVRGKRKIKNRYIGGTASAKVRGRSFFALRCLSCQEWGILGLCMENYGMDAVPLYLQWQEGGGVGETKVCPLCNRRLLDVKRDRAYEVIFELRCPHCGKIVRIVLPARAGLKN